LIFSNPHGRTAFANTVRTIEKFLHPTWFRRDLCRCKFTEWLTLNGCNFKALSLVAASSRYLCSQQRCALHNKLFYVCITCLAARFSFSMAACVNSQPASASRPSPQVGYRCIAHFHPDYSRTSTASRPDIINSRLRHYGSRLWQASAFDAQTRWPTVCPRVAMSDSYLRCTELNIRRLTITPHWFMAALLYCHAILSLLLAFHPRLFCVQSTPPQRPLGSVCE